MGLGVGGVCRLGIVRRRDVLAGVSPEIAYRIFSNSMSNTNMP